MASEQTAVLHSQERPVYINKGSALTQNLIFSAALAGAGTYGLLALQHTLRTGSQWVDATAPNGYSLYQFAYGVIVFFCSISLSISAIRSEKCLFPASIVFICSANTFI